MRIARVMTADGARFGVVEAPYIHLRQGDPVEGLQPTGQAIPLEGAPLLPPVVPGKVVAIARIAHRDVETAFIAGAEIRILAFDGKAHGTAPVAVLPDRLAQCVTASPARCCSRMRTSARR